MKIEVKIMDEGVPERVVELALGDDVTVQELEDALAGALDEPVEHLRDALDLGSSTLPAGLPRSACGTRHVLTLRRVCVEVQYEARPPERIFVAPRAKWRVVHRKACRRFEIARDACADLELRKDSESGPALNENTRVGKLSGCPTVWLVSPGPEEYGSA